MTVVCLVAATASMPPAATAEPIRKRLNDPKPKKNTEVKNIEQITASMSG